MVDIIPNGGLVAALKRIFGQTQNPIQYMGFGTSANTPTSASTALGAECAGGGYARVALELALDVANKRMVATGTLLESNITSSVTLKEYALFDGPSGGTIFGIGQLPSLPKDSTISYKVKVTTEASNVVS